ncbi:MULTISPECIES: hypothetical protein [Actinomadura]|uniref:Uncharacterized protein n=1 Tax=Actinomadura yumaensis TaxID=111807 RepID=A0ABW2CUA1_9ACTN|nr:hypothetical protein [Actinomadura sp. J1-007]MWK37637.1 hypothetical protein [Actinomadura sp. J1-007]
MFIILVVMFGLIGLLASVLYLADFARASRRDALFLPASNRRARRARKVTGMYIRGGDFLDGGEDGEIHGNDEIDYLRGGDDQLVGR